MKKLFVISLIVLLLVASFSFSAVKYPTRTVTFICPWAAGGGTDRLTRFVAGKLQEYFGKPFVVVNKTGGSGAVGHNAGAMARPDGYTITMITFELATMHSMGLTHVTYKDFEPIIELNEDAAAVIVRADAPWETVNDLLEDIKNNPGKYKFSGTAIGGTWDLARIGMLDAAGIPIEYTTWIPSKGAAPALVELLGGHVDVVTCSLPEAVSQLEAGQLKALAIMADERNPKFPDVPTLKEMGINWSAGTWRGVAVPKGTPKEIVDKLYDALLEISKSDDFKDFMAKNGFGIKIRGPEEFKKFLAEQDETWKRVLKIAGYLKEE